MNIRPATHAGSWYSNDPKLLKNQIQNYVTPKPIKGARVLIGPHAGYTYSGERLAETFGVWDSTKAKRIFLLGPSHHVYFKNNVLLSPFDAYETPFGNLPVDTATIKELLKNKLFKKMSEEVDEDEHSFEMHAPFIYHYAEKSKDLPKIIPILISGLDSNSQKHLVDALSPYIGNEENHFVISSDFCHWGSRFGYTKVLSNKNATFDTLEQNLVSINQKPKEFEIYKSIELLDKIALKIATKGSSKKWIEYINTTGNTICGQKPVSIILQLLEKYGSKEGFNWIGYSQSNHATSSRDSSVSYASGYVKL
ncbi:uncharacterized protein KGF55_003377 [Candida pseudojiufengensis]|uniref:uncharacterized protein n=1 Tax=Candida pseudojiufengensis TaxID=497109 RepID=UPI0022243ED0|nr:uncharacterized protein KGF55_003377 [Candida pseudojiufengensis]KAI5962301.1 hypothetical protein KGF55_003377 [Candida pseudojiufengensis]